MVSGLMTNAKHLEDHPENIKIGMPVQVSYVSTEIGKNKEGEPILRWDVGFDPISD